MVEAPVLPPRARRPAVGAAAVRFTLRALRAAVPALRVSLRVSLLLTAILAPGSALARTDITVKGSDTMVLLMKRWAQAYSRSHPDVSLQITGGGTGTGMAALINRTTDICMASRPIRTDELEAAIKTFRRRPVRHDVALDALVIFVNESLPLKEISLDDLSRLFGGRLRNWRGLGGPDAPVVLYSRENSSGTYEFFKEHVLGGQDFAPQTQTLPGTAAVVAAVARDTRGIGYGGVALAEGARQLPVRARPDDPPVFAARNEVVEGRYPISRRLQLYVDPGRDVGAVREFTRWVMSEAGQSIVEEVGFFPLPPQRPPSP